MQNPSELPEFPASGQYIAAVRASCRTCVEEARVRTHPSAISRLLASPYLKSSYSDLSTSHGVSLPLVFPNGLAELNFLALLSLLNFGAAYRVPLHKATGRGVYDNIRALMFSLYLDESQNPSLMSARGMQGIRKEKVAELLQVSMHEESAHATIPGLTVGELRGPIFDFVSKITGVLNETGSILMEQGYADLGTFVAEALKEAERVGRASGLGPSADVVLERLVRAFPAFRDMSIVNGKPVYIFKKALFLIHTVSLRFGSTTSSPFPIPDTTDLPIFSDNVVPSMLVHLGIIDLTGSLYVFLTDAFGRLDPESLLSEPPAQPVPTTRTIPDPGPALSPELVTILRAAAITACDDVVRSAQGHGDLLTTVGLDGWLWAGAKKRSDWRTLGRFVESDAGVFF